MRILHIFLSVLTAAACVLSVLAFPAGARAEEMPYHITVDLTNQIVTIYRLSDGSVTRQMLCSAGLGGSTPTGTFQMTSAARALDRKEWYYFQAFGCYAKYASRIINGIMFHSIPCSRTSESSVSKKALSLFGQPASHGCIRLRFDDAEFIAKNCLPGTTVVIYYEDEVNEDLRERLMESSYTDEAGLSYAAFLGLEEGAAAGGMTYGEEVENLQLRLRALGFYGNVITGVYSSTTINAVKEVQRTIGVEPTGYADEALTALIYSTEAPTSTEATLHEGNSGPNVLNLQQWLRTLRLYDHDMDGIYDAEVIEAVKLFQQVYGYTINGTVTPEIQRAIRYEAGRMSERFGDEEVEVELLDTRLPVASITTKLHVRIRVHPRSDSETLDSLDDGTLVVVMEKGKGWSAIRYGTTTGYVKNRYLVYDGTTVHYLRYTCKSGPVMIIGNSAEDYKMGMTTPAEQFADILALENTSVDMSSLSSEEETVPSAAVVDTGDDSVMLNLRETASTDGAILTKLPNGTEVEVIIRGNTWSLVSWDGMEGYLMSAYLNIGAPDGESALFAVALRDATVYDVDSEDANAVGTLPKGARVQVLQSDEDWTWFEYEGQRGYVDNGSLRFSLSEDVI